MSNMPNTKYSTAFTNIFYILASEILPIFVVTIESVKYLLHKSGLGIVYGG